MPTLVFEVRVLEKPAMALAQDSAPGPMTEPGPVKHGTERPSRYACLRYSLAFLAVSGPSSDANFTSNFFFGRRNFNFFETCVKRCNFASALALLSLAVKHLLLKRSVNMPFSGHRRRVSLKSFCKECLPTSPWIFKSSAWMRVVKSYPLKQAMAHAN